MKWTREKIMERLQEHYEDALKHFPEEQIIGVFLQGSQNYGLATDESDIDTKLIVVPSFEEIAFNKKPVSTTFVRENDEHIDFKDIRLMFATFRKQNLNFIEILFTPYRIVNPMYADLWMPIDLYREQIAHYNRVKCCKTMMGIASEKYRAMEHEYPSRKEWLDKFSYDPKQLHHLLRIEEFLCRYIDGESFAACLLSENPKYLIRVKKGLYDLEQARIVADKAMNFVKTVVDEYCANNEDKANPEVDKLLDDAQLRIMRRAMGVK